VTGLGYTVPAVASVAVVCAAELTVLRTGLFRRPAYWVAMAIVLAFQIPVDGWLTKLSAPIVLYRPAAISGARWPWNIPVEDFGFAFAMIALTLALWERALRRERALLAGRRGAPSAAPAPQSSGPGHGIRS
jgi:lycopene cyclase domain-containing protein